MKKRMTGRNRKGMIRLGVSLYFALAAAACLCVMGVAEPLCAAAAEKNSLGAEKLSGGTGEEHAELLPVTPASIDRKDGEYSVALDMEGGSGKAFITSPTLLIVKDGKAYARVEWSSSNYDYMIVGTEKYENLSEENANSVFEIPIGCWDQEMTVIGDTTAMGTPHEVKYTLVFYKDSVGSKGQLPREAAKRVVIVAVIIIVGGGILNGVLKRRRR